MLVTLALFLQLAVAGVLLASGVAKVRGDANRETWKALLDRVPGLLGRLPVDVVSSLHIGVEILLAVALLVAIAPPLAPVAAPALAAAALMFTGFTGIALYSATGAAVTCSCFGRSTTSLGWPHVVRNVALTVLAVGGLVAASDAVADPLPDLGSAALAVVGAAAVTALTYFFDDVVDVFAPLDPRRSGTRVPTR
ncbi:MauE/DoxX family redox-associated membrane protein [Promicromonospora sp. NPDC060204]|uniref:MauE/DoxX family redox-associated membrane protein n=1 Tax=Promicromonospora sp. NPDC060204 TaxID=3347071 RepID=UPI0036683950